MFRDSNNTNELKECKKKLSFIYRHIDGVDCIFEIYVSSSASAVGGVGTWKACLSCTRLGGGDFSGSFFIIWGFMWFFIVPVEIVISS